MIRHLLKLVWHRKRANALIAVEIFFSFLVVFGVVTIASAVVSGWRKPLGYQWKDVWVVRVSRTGDGAEGNVALRANLEAAMREIKSVPGVIDASLDAMPPFSNMTSEGVWKIEGRTVRLTRDKAGDSYANVMRMKPIRGRWFMPSDDAMKFIPVVIDSDLSRALYDEKDPIGRKFDEMEGTEYRVVGVVPPYRKDGELSSPNLNMVFFRTSLNVKDGDIPQHIIVRVRPGTPGTFEADLARRVHGVLPDVGVSIRRMEAMREFSNRLRTTPLIMMSIIALFLISMVTLGLTGVLWQTVTSRRREIGLRRAVGAPGGRVRTQVLGEVALLATFAVAIGLAIVLQLPLLGIFRLVTPAVFTSGIAGAVAVIYAITLLCGAYPSWLASSVQPAEALRYE